MRGTSGWGKPYPLSTLAVRRYTLRQALGYDPPHPPSARRARGNQLQLQFTPGVLLAEA
jgi:hypothetical protein